jgi:hypothetical protein
MTSVEEFIEVRNSIETLAKQIIIYVGRNAVQDSLQRLDEANRQLETLKAMVANDVQVVVAGRLARQLAGLETEVQAKVAKAAKAPAKKAAAAKKASAKKAAAKKEAEAAG